MAPHFHKCLLYFNLGSQRWKLIHKSHAGCLFVVLSPPPIAACGGELNAPSGTISSPNYPNLYPHSRVCRWELVVSLGRRVTLTIDDLRLEDSGAFCAFDYVDVSPFCQHFLMIHHFTFSTLACSLFTFTY